MIWTRNQEKSSGTLIASIQSVKNGFFLHIDGSQNVQQLFNAIGDIKIRIIKSTWVTNYPKIAKHGQNLRFHFLVEKWLCLGELLTKKNRKSWKHVFLHELNDSESKKKFFRKNFFEWSKKKFSKKKFFRLRIVQFV